MAVGMATGIGKHEAIGGGGRRRCDADWNPTREIIN